MTNDLWGCLNNGVDTSCSTCMNPCLHNRHFSASVTPFLRRLDKGGVSLVAFRHVWRHGGLPEAITNVLASYLLNRHEGENVKLRGLHSALPFTISRYALQPRLIVGILCS